MLKIESYRRGIVISSVFNIIHKVLLFLNSLVIAYYFGTQLKVDIYFYAYNTIVIISTFIATTNTAVIIPESMRIRVSGGHDKASAFLNLFLYTYIGLTALLSIIFLINPIQVFTTFSKFDYAVLSSYNQLLYMAIPLIMLMPVTTLLTDILASYRFFTVPVIAGIINSVLSLVFITFFNDTLDTKSILLGLLISYSLNISILCYLLVRKLNWKFTLVSRPSKHVIVRILYSQTGNFVTSLSSYAPLYFLSGTVAGIIASLNYAQQIVMQTSSVITYQVSVVSRIKLSELYAEKKYKKLNEIFLTTTRFLVFVLFPISALMFLYSEQIISFLFERGSFTDRSVELSSDMLRLLALSLPFTAVVSIAGNLYVAAQLIRISMIYQVISNVLLIALIASLVHMVGYTGYPIAYLLINIINVLVVYIYCRHFFPYINYIALLKYITYMLALNGVLAGVLYMLSKYGVLPSNFAGMFVGGILYGIILLALNYKFNLNADFNNFAVKLAKKTKLINA